MSGYLAYQRVTAVVPSKVRPFAKAGLKEILFNWRRITSSSRSLPDFVIIGAQKAGTTSLFEYLCQHESVLAGPWKETRFFDKYYGQGIDWYRAFFPLRSQCAEHRADGAAIRKLTGEATPEYLFDARVPARMQRHLVNVRLIVVLRDPRYRAYSHYQHAIGFGWNPASTFRNAMKGELSRMTAMNGGLSEDWYDSADAAHSYLWRGHYAEQLKRWLIYFPREQIHVLRTEDLASDPTRVTLELERFLGIRHSSSTRLRRLNTREYTTMDSADFDFVTEYFTPHNQRLSQLLGPTFTW